MPYTRAGCNFGSVAAADTELENTTPDVPLVFGAHSWEAKEAENAKLANKAQADFMGLSVHCAAGPRSVPGAPRGRRRAARRARRLPGVPRAVRQPVHPAALISPAGPVRNLDGQVIKDTSGDIGFPGYNGMDGSNALAYTLDMQTHGVPVTFTYLTDLHDNVRHRRRDGLRHRRPTRRQLRQENAAFGTFFTDLARAGITKANTLFVITADEGDHFVGRLRRPANCDGVTITCSYGKVGEVDGNLTGMLAAKGISDALRRGGRLGAHRLRARAARPDQRAVRTMERTAARLTADDLATGQTVRLTNYLADPVEMNLLHMITGDPEAHGHVRAVRQPGLLAR